MMVMMIIRILLLLFFFFFAFFFLFLGYLSLLCLRVGEGDVVLPWPFLESYRFSYHERQGEGDAALPRQVEGGQVNPQPGEAHDANRGGMRHRNGSGPLLHVRSECRCDERHRGQNLCQDLLPAGASGAGAGARIRGNSGLGGENPACPLWVCWVVVVSVLSLALSPLHRRATLS